MNDTPHTTHAVGQCIAQRDLLRQLWTRDLAARYRGSLLGVMWALMTPLLILLIYTFVFGVVFQARWGNASHADSPAFFAITLYSGLIIHQLAAEILSRSTSILTHHSNYVKKVVFPLPLLSVMVVLTALTMATIQIVLLLAAVGVVQQTLSWTWVFIPIVIAPYALLLLGVSWLLASIGVFLRDLDQLMGLIVMLLLFLSPVFYPISALPEAYRGWIYLNPLTPIIENMRAVTLNHTQPDWAALGLYTLAALVVCQLGWWWFKRTRKGFNDVL